MHEEHLDVDVDAEMLEAKNTLEEITKKTTELVNQLQEKNYEGDSEENDWANTELYVDEHTGESK